MSSITSSEAAKAIIRRNTEEVQRSPYMVKRFRWSLMTGGCKAVPGSSFVVFEADEGGGHAMFWEGPRKYNDSLRTFLRSS